MIGLAGSFLNLFKRGRGIPGVLGVSGDGHPLEVAFGHQGGTWVPHLLHP
jgi:hypothetical protein